MGVLNNIGQLLITKAFWSNCINFFVKFLGNYGWAIILFTVVLKLIMTPLDFLQRRSMKKSQQMMAGIQPELKKLQEKYANDRETLNKKTNELYQRNNVSMKGTCLPMLITMVVTMVVFISLFNALNAIAKTKDSEIFYDINNAYNSQIERIVAENPSEYEGKTHEEIVSANRDIIKDAVVKEYKNQKKKHGFLWIQNLWKADATTSPLVSFDTFKDYYDDKVETVNEEELKSDYNTIKTMILEENPKNNGCFVLILLCAGVTLLVQWLSQLSMKKTSGDQSATSGKMMLIIMPIIMLIFAFTSNALFCLYIITNSIMSAIISKIIDLFLKDKNGTNTPKQINTKSKNVVEYSRNYFKD